MEEKLVILLAELTLYNKKHKTIKTLDVISTIADILKN